MTVCTNSRAQKEIIAKVNHLRAWGTSWLMYLLVRWYMYMYIFPFQYLDETADNLNGLPFKLHDFGFRGSTSVEVDNNIV